MASEGNLRGAFVRVVTSTPNLTGGGRFTAPATERWWYFSGYATAAALSFLAESITEAVKQQLRERGFEVEVLEDVKRPTKNPDDIDDDHVASPVDADAVLHIWIDEVGMYSGHFSDKYVPRINIRGRLWTRSREDSLYSDEVDYGVDARKGKSWAIAAFCARPPVCGQAMAQLAKTRAFHLAASSRSSSRPAGAGAMARCTRNRVTEHRRRYRLQS